MPSNRNELWMSVWLGQEATERNSEGERDGILK